MACPTRPAVKSRSGSAGVEEGRFYSSGKPLQIWNEEPDNDTENSGDDERPGEVRVDREREEVKLHTLGVIDNEQCKEQECSKDADDAGDGLPVARTTSFHVAPQSALVGSRRSCARHKVNRSPHYLTAAEEPSLHGARLEMNRANEGGK